MRKTPGKIIGAVNGAVMAVGLFFTPIVAQAEEVQVIINAVQKHNDMKKLCKDGKKEIIGAVREQAEELMANRDIEDPGTSGRKASKKNPRELHGQEVAVGFFYTGAYRITPPSSPRS